MRPAEQYLAETSSGKEFEVHIFDVLPYAESLKAMADFSRHRNPQTRDQIWLLQHSPIYTQGSSCAEIPLLQSDIPIIKTDRGGQITYHGPGQIVMYPLLQLKRYKIGVKSLVNRLEQSVIELLAEYGLTGNRRNDAPGVYIDDAKIAALGLRITRGHSYHGLSLNVNMDLRPFSNINPCGYRNLTVTQLSDCVDNSELVVELGKVQKTLLERFIALI